MNTDDMPVLFSPAVGKKGINGLHYAAYCGNLDALRIYLDAGFDPNTKDQYRGYTALHWLADMAAVGGPCLEMLRLLVSNGADIHLHADNGETVLSLARAATSGTGDEMVAELLALGAKV